MNNIAVKVGDCLGEDVPCEWLPEKLKAIFGQTCVKSYMECNKKRDCENFFDERQCYSEGGVQCSDQDDMFTCDNGNCIPNEMTCNYYDNCGDASDETSALCPQLLKNNCTDEQWRCKNGECIDYFSYVCDEYLDCGDMSDEMNCADEMQAFNLTMNEDESQSEDTDDNTESKLNCNTGEFPCGEVCENNIRRCDRISDCPRGIDENNCNYTVNDPFPDGWFEPYQSILLEDDTTGFFDDFKNNIYKDRGYYFIPKEAEDPPIWTYFYINKSWHLDTN
ncbi:uncharacterized protein LOC144433034 [Glandiceps talaboti]